MGGGGVAIHGTTDVGRIEAPVTLKAYLICAFAAFGGIFFGYDTGWMSGVLAMPYFITQYTGLPKPAASDTAAVNAFHLTAQDQSLTTSILSAGTFFGAIAAGDIADFIGRRVTIIVGCGVFTVGCILETASTSLGVMVPGRFISAIGMLTSVVILYMSEIAPRKVRGALVSGYQFCITIGILIANGAVYGTKQRNDSGSYRIPIAIQFAWALVLAIGLVFLPESPRYFVKKGRVEEAAKALASVRGQPIDSEYIQDELAEIVANFEYEQSVIPQTSYIGGWTNCFSGSLSDGSSNLRRSILGIMMQMMQQLTGINFIFYFGNVFFTSLGTIHNPFLISILTALVNTVCTPVAFWAVDKIGRRSLLIWGAVGMIASQLIVGVIGVTAGRLEKHNNSAVSAMIAFICFNIAFFSVTWGPVAWVVVGEVFPIPIRSRGVGLATSSNWFWNCIIGVITPYLVGTEKHDANLGAKVFFMWGGLCCISLTFAYFLVPETKGLSLEQVDRMLEETSPRTSSKWVPHSTFAADMGLVNKGGNSTSAEETIEVSNEKSMV
ncbi:general substrate transporter [Hyaloscypha bicolor E]|uniref:General substrate transporter n=1 Tax=Hyaloscypha bicolor E TaxID=1095630 RepID=A0A2J6T740_9HELO|nr:general substrate transporter [Hyaloscypha bicolor E]PMD58830.1 general substrate transporter [Hyaloscypha bicolor E]